MKAFRNMPAGQILRQAISSQINRLHHKCSNKTLSTLQQKICALENTVSYLTYEYNQKIEWYQSHRQHLDQKYIEILDEKKYQDIQLKRLVQNNRNSLGNLQKNRKRLKEQIANAEDLEHQNIELANTEDRICKRLENLNTKITEQKQWINRFRTTEQLCRKEICQQKQNISSLKQQTKLQNIKLVSSTQGKEDIKRQIQKYHQIQQTVCRKSEKDKINLELQYKQNIKELQQLKKQEVERTQIVNHLQNMVDIENHRIKKVQNERLGIESHNQEIQMTVVKKMLLSEELSNQIFQTKVNSTNCKIKIKQSSQKRQRLLQLKERLLEMMINFREDY